MQKDQAATGVRARAEAKAGVEQVLSSIMAAGHKTLYGFVDELPTIHDQQLSSCIFNMLGQHWEAIFGSIQACQPDLVKQWAVSISGKLLTEEG